MERNNNYPRCEATKRGEVPPQTPTLFHKWREAVDPDSMGFDGTEGPENET